VRTGTDDGRRTVLERAHDVVSGPEDREYERVLARELADAGRLATDDERR
jgi:hypothetical protein